MSPRLLARALCLSLTACALLPSEQVSEHTSEQVVDKPVLMPMAQPMGPARRVVQQLTAVWADRQQSLLAVLELDAQHIAMSGLSNDGLSLFNLTFDGKTILADKSPLLPESVNPEYFITDLQLVYWPHAELQKNLPAQWRLESANNKRSLYFNDKKQAEVDYLTPDPFWPKEAELVNFQYHYRLHIKTISYDPLP